MANITVTVTDSQQLALNYIMTDATTWTNNALHERARIATNDILNMLLKHCNANGVTMATGEAAQLQQAYDLNIINTAQEREDASGPS